MRFPTLSKETGSIKLYNKFISVRIIQEKLKEKNTLEILKESATFLKCRPIRMARLFGGPWPGPYPTLSFRIERINDTSTIHYDFFWPEYIMILIYMSTGVIPVSGLTCGFSSNHTSFVVSLKGAGILLTFVNAVGCRIKSKVYLTPSY